MQTNISSSSSSSTCAPNSQQRGSLHSIQSEPQHGLYTRLRAKSHHPEPSGRHMLTRQVHAQHTHLLDTCKVRMCHRTPERGAHFSNHSGSLHFFHIFRGASIFPLYCGLYFVSMLIADLCFCSRKAPTCKSGGERRTRLASSLTHALPCVCV